MGQIDELNRSYEVAHKWRTADDEILALLASPDPQAALLAFKCAYDRLNLRPGKAKEYVELLACAHRQQLSPEMQRWADEQHAARARKEQPNLAPLWSRDANGFAYCPDCGLFLEGAAAICSRCGADIIRRRSEVPRPPGQLTQQQITSVLQRFQPMDNYYVGTEIPKDKLYSAVSSIGIEEPVLALIDCTLFGSAKDAIVFGEQAVYWKKRGMQGKVSYGELQRAYIETRNDYTVAVGDGRELVVSGVPAAALAAILSDLKTLGRKQAQSAAPTGVKGLVAVAGMTKLKHMLQVEVVDVFRNADKYRRYGLTIPNGILLFGPPGCGKTFIARQLANELGYNYLEILPSETGSMYVHESVLKIRDIFQQAANKSPSVVFIDEFEALVPARSELGGHQQHKAEEVNEFLGQMNNCSERGVLVIAATNEPWKIDPAVQRAGRLDKKIYVGPPDEAARADMLRHHAKGRPCSPDLDLSHVAATLEGYSASDLKLLVDEAARSALIGEQPISKWHFLAAATRVPPSITREQEDDYKSFGTRG